ncbi:hypothetical protein Ancab_009221 [Ancistrocladus abbreviatus]
MKVQMASYSLSKCIHAVAGLALTLALLVQATREIRCEQLSKDECAFAVSSSGRRCVLDKLVRRSGEKVYKCSTSEIEATDLKEKIESDACIKACGLERHTLGISSDALLDLRFTQKLCSPQCYYGCPNVVDLYFDLAAGEGVFLPKFCEKIKGGEERRELVGIKSSGDGYVALAPQADPPSPQGSD